MSIQKIFKGGIVNKFENLPIKCFGSYCLLKDIELVEGTDCPEKDQIYKGTRIVELGTPKDELLNVYFTMRESETDLDKMFPVYHVTDKEILGCEFYIVPKERCLFGCGDPSTIIAHPPIKRSRSRLVPE